MTFYSQKDPKWATLTYDGVNTFRTAGCLVTSLAMMCDKTPVEVANILSVNGLFTNGYINNSGEAARVLGLEYYGKSLEKPDYDCIAETDYWQSGGALQHFFVVLKDGTRLDPLNSIHKDEYKIISYRLFKTKEDLMKYPLFGNKPDGKIYFLTNTYTKDNVLIPVKNEKDLRDNFGLDPIIDWKDDVWVAGVPVDTMIDSKSDCEDVVDELTIENKKLKEQVELDKKTWDKHKCEVSEISFSEALKIVVNRIGDLWKK